MQNKKTDVRIQQDIINELKWDTRVDANDVGVTVHSGVVTLTGTVPGWAKKLAAADAAHRVNGVLDVANDLSVKLANGASRGDADIAGAVRHALKWDVFVPDEKIQSTVMNGAVTLVGHVPFASQREDAARAVRNLTGVRIVDNRITVDRAEVTPAAIRVAIHDALERHASRDADKIQIDVVGTNVTLRGNVESWPERTAIVGAAWGTRGVENVIDQMHIA
jgi:osmotically-inducible protein OsmY